MYEFPFALNMHLSTKKAIHSGSLKALWENGGPSVT